MKSVTLELENFSPPSNNEIRRMNRWVYRKLVRGLRERIMLALGEGPWPKVTFDKCEHPKAMREAILKELQKLWQPRETVYAETMIRRPRRFDSDNHHGGMKPLWDAIVRAGPPLARVTRVTTQEVPHEIVDAKSFVVKH